MNAFNRIVMLILALLLIAVPVLVLLIAIDVLSPDLINQYTGYRSVVDALGNFSPQDVAPEARLIIAIVGALVALLALLLLLRELTFGRRVARSATLQDEPGKETVITAKAVRMLAEGAAREAGARDPSVSLSSEKGPYVVMCDALVPGSGNYTETATRIRENIARVLESQRVPVRDVEVTVRGTAS
jgi:hypothetical protein